MGEIDLFKNFSIKINQSKINRPLDDNGILFKKFGKSSPRNIVQVKCKITLPGLEEIQKKTKRGELDLLKKVGKYS